MGGSVSGRARASVRACVARVGRVCVWGGGRKGGSVSGRAARVRTRPPHRLGAPRNDSVSCADNHETETPREYAINWMIY